MSNQVNVRISAGFFLLLAIMLMILPIQWVFAMMVAGMIHELFHLLAIYLLGGTANSISIGLRGTVIEMQEMKPAKELVCALAGPIGSGLLLVTLQWFPRLAICGTMHCLFNLLPLYPFDGGRVLRSLINLCIHPKRSGGLWKWSQIVIHLVFAALGVILAVKYQIYAMPVLFFFLYRLGKEKALANKPFWRYNMTSITKGNRYDRIETKNPPQRSKTGAIHRRRV